MIYARRGRAVPGSRESASAFRLGLGGMCTKRQLGGALPSAISRCTTVLKDGTYIENDWSLQPYVGRSSVALYPSIHHLHKLCHATSGHTKPPRTTSNRCPYRSPILRLQSDTCRANTSTDTAQSFPLSSSALTLLSNLASLVNALDPTKSRKMMPRVPKHMAMAIS